MVMEKERRFVAAKLRIEFNGQSTEVDAHVSTMGATRIFFQNTLPPFLSASFGKEISIIYKNHSCTGLLIQQNVDHGIYYDIKFLKIPAEANDQIQKDIDAEGSTPSWIRKHPRITVESMETELPVPSLCTVYFLGQPHFVNVLNFTLGGIRVETVSDELEGLRVGAKVQFDLIATNGMVFNNMSGVVRNISTRIEQRESGAITCRSFGLQLVDMHPINEKNYKQLIKEYCLMVQKKIAAE